MLSPTRKSRAFRRRRRHCALNVLLPLVAEARSDLTTVVRAEAARSTRNVAVRNRTVSGGREPANAAYLTTSLLLGAPKPGVVPVPSVTPPHSTAASTAGC